MAIVRLAALLCLLVVVGCQKSTPTSVPTMLALTSSTQPGVTAPATGSFAEGFLKSVKAGKAKASDLTADFKKLIAPATTDADKAVGYSDWAAEAWLADLATKVNTDKLTTVNAGTTSYITTPKLNGETGRTVMVVVMEAGKPKVDGLHIAALTSEYNLAIEPVAAYTAVAFLDSVLTGQTKLTQKLLSPSAKLRVAPPLDDLDKAQGFNAGILGIKLSNFRGKASYYNISAMSKNPIVFTGELFGPTENRKFTLKLVTIGGNTLVEDFDPN
jgi:hypothetical protein